MTGSNTNSHAVVTVASMTIDRVTRSAGGSIIVQPAVWIATRTTPDAADVFIYGAGALGGVLSVPAIVTGAVKALVDDNVQARVDQAKQQEHPRVQNFIRTVGDYSFWGSNNTISALEIANQGGVAWEHDNGAIMFLADADGIFVTDYRPRSFKTLYRPRMPLTRGRNGMIPYQVERR